MRPATISDLAQIGSEGWFACPCGHRADVSLPALARRWPGASIAAVRRAARCTGCRYLSRPLLGVRLKPAQPSPPTLQLVGPGYKPQKRLDFIGLAFEIVAAKTLDQLKKDDPDAHARLTAEPSEPFAHRDKWLD